MASAKEIRTKIGSVKNTQKITKAMEMVAASKMRRAQDRVLASRPYAERLRRTMGHLSKANPEYKHPFIIERDVKRVAYIVVSTDRGLCGGLNINMFRKMLGELKQWKDKGVDVDLTIIGSKARSFFNRLGHDIIAEQSNLGDKPHPDQLIGLMKVTMDAYREEKVDRVFLMGNDFVNTMTQKPHVQQLLPVAADIGDYEDGLLDTWDYLYEPEASELLDDALMRFVESQIYQSVVENVACEMAARMVAMKSASDNAGDIIDGLQLAYNKARQSAITQELAEIVGGAAAV